MSSDLEAVVGQLDPLDKVIFWAVRHHRSEQDEPHANYAAELEYCEDELLTAAIEFVSSRLSDRCGPRLKESWDGMVAGIVQAGHMDLLDNPKPTEG